MEVSHQKNKGSEVCHVESLIDIGSETVACIIKKWRIGRIVEFMDLKET